MARDDVSYSFAEPTRKSCAAFACSQPVVSGFGLGESLLRFILDTSKRDLPKAAQVAIRVPDSP